MKATYYPVYLWVPRDCPLGQNGAMVAVVSSLAAAEALNERAREFAGHVQVVFRDGTYVSGCAEEAGFK